MTPALPLAAIPFDSGDIDHCLAAVAQRLEARGYRVRGALQTRGTASGACHCADMDLTMLGSGRTFRISQPLGAGSRGCRLDPGALADCAAVLEAELDADTDLLILNRFGKGESEGRGFRDLIGAALARDVPVLTAFRPTYAADWATFGSDLACTLPMAPEAVCAWFDSIHRTCHAA